MNLSIPTAASRVETGTARWAEEIRDVATLRDFLVGEPEKTAYFLGDLEARYFEVTRWFGERDADGLTGVVMRYDGHSLPAVLCYGAPGAVRRVLATFREKLPERFELHAFPEHRDAIQKLFPDLELQRRLRMRLVADDFRWDASTGKGVVRLGHADTADLIRLYGRSGLAYFDPYQLETGLYFGIHSDDGSLVSSAGVHVVSEEVGVAGIGNVATHPDYRGRGLSTRCTGRLVSALQRRRVSTIILNVAANNRPAIHVYRSLGFREHTELVVGIVGGRPQRAPIPGRFRSTYA